MILLIFLGAVFLSVMILAVVLPFRPQTLKLASGLVCRKGEEMEIILIREGHHGPGERSISIYCNDHGRRRDVKVPTLLAALGAAFIVALPVAAAIAVIFIRLAGGN